MSLQRRVSRRPRGRWLMVVLALATGLVLAVPLAWASHQFTDVPDGHQFHTEIAAIAGAGITGGKTCAPPGTPPTYCPTENVNRQAMAAFLHRGLSRVAYSNAVADATIESSDDWPTDVMVADIDIDVGGVGADVTQFVEITADVSVGDLPDTFLTTPYFLYFYLAEGDQSDGANRSVTFTQRIRDAEIENDTVSISWVRPAAPGPHTYKLHAFTTEAQAVANVTALALTATTHPFGSTGGSTLAVEPNDRPRP